MMRWAVVIGLAGVMLGAAALAAGETQGQQAPGNMPMMQGRGMMGGMMGAGGLAAWDGNIYLLNGDTLEKLNQDLEVVQSVELPMPEMPMMRPGTGGAAAAEMPMGMHMRCMAMLRAEVDALDPQALLALQGELGLTDDQSKKLQALADTAGAGAKDVLTDDQKAKVRDLEATPRSMMEMGEPMHRHMMEMMGGQGGMMGPGGAMGTRGPMGRGGMMRGAGRGGMMGRGRMMGQGAMMAAPANRPEGMVRGMGMRCGLMMRLELDAYSPQALLALKPELGLTDEQTTKLEALAATARTGAEGVLTDEQKSQLKELKETPRSMMQMQGPMRQMMMRMMRPRMGMMHPVNIAADAKGVYVFAAGKLTVYDHDLKEVNSKSLAEISGGIE